MIKLFLKITLSIFIISTNITLVAQNLVTQYGNVKCPKDSTQQHFLSYILVFNDTYCTGTLSDEIGYYNTTREDNWKKPIYIFGFCRDHLPSLELVENRHQDIILKPNESFTRHPYYAAGLENDNTYYIEIKYVDAESERPIEGLASFLIDFPNYVLTKPNGIVKFFTPQIKIIEKYEKDSLTIIGDKRGYIPSVKKISKKDLISNQRISVGITKMTKIKNGYDDEVIKKYFIDLNDSIDKLNIIKVNLSGQMALKDSLLKIHINNGKQITTEDIETVLKKLNPQLLTRENFLDFLLKTDTLYFSTNRRLSNTLNHYDSLSRIYTTKLDSIIQKPYNKYLFDTLTNLNIIAKNTDSITEAYYKIFTNILKMPDTNLRVYACIDYGFLNRPNSSLFVKIGTKFDFTELGLRDLINQDKFYFDLSGVINASNNPENKWFDQANLNLNYRLINRNYPYFSMDIGMGYSWGTRYNYKYVDSAKTWGFDGYISGFNLELNIVGKVTNKLINTRKTKDNLYVCFNASTRFVFDGGIQFEYGIPIFGLGLIYNKNFENHKRKKVAKDSKIITTNDQELDLFHHDEYK
jgi:putative transposon-encoded protein